MSGAPERCGIWEVGKVGNPSSSVYVRLNMGLTLASHASRGTHETNFAHITREFHQLAGKARW